MLNHQQRTTLLNIARASIQSGLAHNKPLRVNKADYDQQLQSDAASFVTLSIDTQLRGCIGTLQADKSLVEDVAEHAFAAAFRDPRFPPLTNTEYPRLAYHISILGEPEKIACDSEQDLVTALQQGIDGLILEDENHRATFLPSVWESLPDKQNFVTQLKLKAGFSRDFWSEKMRCFRYSVEEFGNDDK